MDGIVDLTFEAHSDLDNIPTTAGRGWLASHLSSADWTVPLNPGAIDEVRGMVRAMRATPLPTLLRHPAQFDIPNLTEAYEAAKSICDNGAGFAVLDRLPMDEFDVEEMVDIYWTLGQLMAPNVAQKWDGTMIYDVTDTGKTYGYGVRGSTTNVELVFHTDNAFAIKVPDYVGLLCRYPAKQGGLSRFCSLYTVHHRMEERYPEALRRLYQPMHFDRQAEHAKGDAKTSYAPFLRGQAAICAAAPTARWCARAMPCTAPRWIASWFPHWPPLMRSPRPRICGSKHRWERGQIQYLNNHEPGHYRSEFEDSDDPATKRHLYRLWHRTEGGINYDG